MDRTLLNRGMLYDQAASYDRLLHVSGVPREHWGVTRAQVAFETFRQDRLWRDTPDSYAFKDADQQAIYDGLLAVLKGEQDGSLADYAGLVACVSSMVTPVAATQAVGLIVRTLLDNHPAAKVTWLSACERSKWGQPIGPDLDDVPDLCVIAGLAPNPTRETYETVQRFYEWARRYCLVLMIGTGADPVDLAVAHFRVMPSITWMPLSMVGAARTRSFG